MIDEGRQVVPCIARVRRGLAVVLLNGGLFGRLGFEKGGWAGVEIARRAFRRITPRWDHVKAAAGSASIGGAVCSVAEHLSTCV